MAGPTPDATTDIGWWTEWRYPVRRGREEPFVSVVLSPAMGRNAQRLLGRDQPMRVWHDIVACKAPVEADRPSKATLWHQDQPDWAVDRKGLTFWIALDHVAPDQGCVQYLSGSFREGPLGMIPRAADADGKMRGLPEEYPELDARYSRSAPYHLEPGDVAVHHSFVVHGAGENRSSRPRWSYIVSYIPGDARYNGLANGDSDGLGLGRGDHFDLPDFPLAGA